MTYSSQHSTLLLQSAAMAIACCTVAAGGPRYGENLDWITVGAPGNEAFQGGPIGQMAGRGQVAYEYRLTQTELTVGEWQEFLAAYAPYAPEPVSFELTGFFFQPIPRGNGTYTYQLIGDDSLKACPMNMSWRAAAIYCNWLSNDRGTTKDAFANGAYDVSSFTFDANGKANDQSTHNADAKYWIPTLDEWMKAAYYDPSLNSGLGGWWDYPNASDLSLIIGLPGSGDTNASLFGQYPLTAFAAGSYGDVMSPWGFRDMSGGWGEYTEEWDGPNFFRLAKGSGLITDDFNVAYYDHIYNGQPMSVTRGLGGVRLASSIPAPASVLLVVAGWALLGFRRSSPCAWLSARQRP